MPIWREGRQPVRLSERPLDCYKVCSSVDAERMFGLTQSREQVGVTTDLGADATLVRVWPCSIFQYLQSTNSKAHSNIVCPQCGHDEYSDSLKSVSLVSHATLVLYSIRTSRNGRRHAWSSFSSAQNVTIIFWILRYRQRVFHECMGFGGGPNVLIRCFHPSQVVYVKLGYALSAKWECKL